MSSLSSLGGDIRNPLSPLTAVIIVLAVAVGAAVAFSSPWAVLGFVAAVFALVFLLSSGKALFLVVFIAKPFADMLWFAKFGVGEASFNTQSVISLAVLGAGVITIVLRQMPLPRTLFVPMAFFVLANAVALLLTPSLLAGADSFVRIVTAFPLVFVVPAIIDELPGPRNLVRIFLAVMGVVYVTVLLQPLGLMAYSSMDSGGVGRATGLYYHPWDVARYLVIAMPLVLVALADKRNGHIERAAYWALLAATVAVTYVTQLKMAWIAVLLEVVLWYVLSGRPRKALLVFLLVVVVVAFPGRQAVLTAFGDLGKLPDPNTRAQALSGRVFIWSEYLAGLQKASPGEILIGQGFQPKGLAASGRQVHDDYLRVLVMNGVVGLVAYGVLILAALRYLSRAVRVLRTRGGIAWRIGIGVQCLMGAYLLMGLTADPSTYPSLTMYVWLLIGLVAGYARKVEAGQEIESPARLSKSLS